MQAFQRLKRSILAKRACKKLNQFVSDGLQSMILMLCLMAGYRIHSDFSNLSDTSLFKFAESYNYLRELLYQSGLLGPKILGTKKLISIHGK